MMMNEARVSAILGAKKSHRSHHCLLSQMNAITPAQTASYSKCPCHVPLKCRNPSVRFTVFGFEHLVPLRRSTTLLCGCGSVAGALS